MSSIQARLQAMLSKPQLAGLATVTEDGKPWVRYVMVSGRADMSIRCASFTQARKVAQIKANPDVHLTCGVTDPTQMVPYLQIQGRATFSTEAAERHGFWSDMLKPIFETPDNPHYGVIVVTPYRIELCTPGSMTPEVWEA